MHLSQFSKQLRRILPFLHCSTFFMNVFQRNKNTCLLQGHSATGCKQKFWISNAEYRDDPSTDRRRPFHGAWKQPTGEVAGPTVWWHCSCALAGELCLYCMPVIFVVGLGSGHGSLERSRVHGDSMAVWFWLDGSMAFLKIFEEIGRIHIQPVNRTLWMHHGSVSSIIEKSIMQLPTIVEANTYIYRMLQTQLIVFATSRCWVFLWFHVFFNDEMVDGWLEVTSTHHLDQMTPEEWGIRGSTELPQWFKSFPWFKVVFGNGGCLEVRFAGGYISIYRAILHEFARLPFATFPHSRKGKKHQKNSTTPISKKPLCRETGHDLVVSESFFWI